MTSTKATPLLPRRLITALCLLAIPAAGLSAQTSPPAAGYHVARDITLGGDGRWDYVTVDTARHRLFIARQTRVMVVDPDSGKLLGEVPGLNGAHGVALVYATGHGFATSGHDSTVTMFDLATLHVLRRTVAADDADAVLYDPASKRIFTFNGDAATSSVLDPVSGVLIGSIPLGGKPEFGVTTGDGRAVREPGGQGGDRGDRSHGDAGAPALVPRAAARSPPAWRSTATITCCSAAATTSSWPSPTPCMAR